MLGGGVLFQLLPIPIGRAERWLRIGAWCIGLFGWFLEAVLSTISS
jgi:hypothetical protein